MIETMGSGVGVLDYDHDGRLDLVFVSGGGRPGSLEAGHDRLALYRNLGDGKFEDRTGSSGLHGSFDTYGMGVAIADYDNDGWPDLLLTGYPRSLLFHNNGDGTFTDVTLSSGVENRGRWATSAGWFDYDRDGLLDLVIANYVDGFSWDNPPFCGDAAHGMRAYCHPDVYGGTGLRIYRNEGNGHFRDVTSKAGVESSVGKCLALVLADFDGDGWPDIFVANDSVMNFYYRNRGDGTFEESGLFSGAGFSDDGRTEAGMGADAAYLDGATHPDLYVTHLDNELNRLYKNQGNSRFRDVTVASGLGTAQSLVSGFGVRFADFDNSGRQQILVANGHILDNIAKFHPSVAYREPLALFADAGMGKFRDVSRELGAIFQKPLLGRGLAIGDFDSDGLLDFVVNQNAGPPLIARNRSRGGNWIALDLQGTGKSNRDAIGAEVTITAGGRQQRAQIKGGASYCSSGDMRLHFGLGTARTVDLVAVRWPSGDTETFANIPINRLRRIIERPSR
jgi:enediyne biosynthesis protein E4